MVVWHLAVGDIYSWRYPLPWSAHRAAAWLPERRKEDGEPSQVPVRSIHCHERLLDSRTGPETPLYHPERTAGQDLGAKYDNGTGLSSFCFSVKRCPKFFIIIIVIVIVIVIVVVIVVIIVNLFVIAIILFSLKLQLFFSVATVHFHFDFLSVSCYFQSILFGVYFFIPIEKDSGKEMSWNLTSFFCVSIVTGESIPSASDGWWWRSCQPGLLSPTMWFWSQGLQEVCGVTCPFSVKRGSERSRRRRRNEVQYAYKVENFCRLLYHHTIIVDVRNSNMQSDLEASSRGSLQTRETATTGSHMTGWEGCWKTIGADLI